jgi:hypothetical protein
MPNLRLRTLRKGLDIEVESRALLVEPNARLLAVGRIGDTLPGKAF